MTILKPCPQFLLVCYSHILEANHLIQPYHKIIKKEMNNSLLTFRFFGASFSHYDYNDYDNNDDSDGCY